MRIWIAGAALFLAGCTSLDSDLQAADGKCSQTGTMTVFVTCLNSAEDAVWQKQSPDNLADYRSFAAERMGLAQDLDGGKINAAGFKDGAAEAATKFRGHLAQNTRRQMRQAEQQGNQERTQDTLQQMEKVMPPPGSSTNMGMNNDMGM